jgi:hypothetical protein
MFSVSRVSAAMCAAMPRAEQDMAVAKEGDGRDDGAPAGGAGNFRVKAPHRDPFSLGGGGGWPGWRNRGLVPSQGSFRTAQAMACHFRGLGQDAHDVRCGNSASMLRWGWRSMLSVLCSLSRGGPAGRDGPAAVEGGEGGRRSRGGLETLPVVVAGHLAHCATGQSIMPGLGATVTTGLLFRAHWSAE